MSLGETVTITAEIVVSSDRGELPDNGELEDLLGQALFYHPLNNDGNLSILSVEVKGRNA